MKRYTVSWGNKRVYGCQKLNTLGKFLLSMASKVERGSKVSVNVYAFHTGSNHGVTLTNDTYAYGWYTGVAFAIPDEVYPGLGGRSAMTHYHDGNNCPI